MILSNSCYNAYDVKKKKEGGRKKKKEEEEEEEERKGIDTNRNFKWLWLAIRVWIANGINEVSLVPAFRVTLISYPSLDS